MTTDELLESSPVPCTCRAQLLEKEDGYYTTYVFLDLDTHEYYMVTKYPNWIQPEITIGDVGYLTMYLIVAGKTKWYCKNESTEKEMFVPYRYTHIAFVKFIKDNTGIITRESDEDFKIKVI